MRNNLGLMDPMQLGQSISNAFLMGAQQKAFSNYAQNPSADSARGVAGLNPELGIQLMDREDQRAASEQDMAWKKVENMAKLARSVRDEPTYQRALQIAANLGIDTTGAPPTYDPNWVAQKAQEYEFFAGPQGREAVSNAGKQAMDMGYQPGTPEYTSAVTQLIEASLAQPYTGAQGETRLYTPQIGVQPAQTAPQVSQAPTGPLAGQVIPFEAYVGFARALSAQDAAEWVQRGQIIAVQTPEQAAQLPSGTTYVTPDGQTMRIP